MFVLHHILSIHQTDLAVYAADSLPFEFCAELMMKLIEYNNSCDKPVYVYHMTSLTTFNKYDMTTSVLYFCGRSFRHLGSL